METFEQAWMRVMRMYEIPNLEGAGQLPTVYSSCETIYVVLHPDKHLIPSAARNLSERLKALAAADKRVVLIGSNISEGVIYTLKEAFPGMQVVQVKCNSIWDSIADGWDENVQYLLNRCPYTIWQRPGGGQVDMLSSLVVTFLGMQQKLDNFSGTNPLTNAEIIDIVKSVHGGMHILEEYPYTLPLLIAAVEQAILQRKKEPKC